MHKATIGLLAGLIVIGTVLGGLALSLQRSLGNPIDIPIPTITLEIIAAVTPSPTPSATATAAPTSTVAFSQTLTPTPTACPIPVNWQHYVVGAFDTLTMIAARFNTTGDQLVLANCLAQPRVSVGQTIFVPPIGPTPTLAACYPYPPYGWIPIVIQPGDTLSLIAQRYGISLYYLVRANNCLTTMFIYSGQTIYVPPVAPAVTFTPTPIRPTNTPTIVPTTIAPTIETPTPTITTPGVTITPPGPTDTPASTDTPAPTATTAPTGTPPAPTSTPPAPTSTPQSTDTPPAPTSAPLPTNTSVPPTPVPPTPVPPTNTVAAPPQNTPLPPTP